MWINEMSNEKTTYVLELKLWYVGKKITYRSLYSCNLFELSQKKNGRIDLKMRTPQRMRSQIYFNYSLNIWHATAINLNKLHMYLFAKAYFYTNHYNKINYNWAAHRTKINDDHLSFDFFLLALPRVLSAVQCLMNASFKKICQFPGFRENCQIIFISGITVFKTCKFQLRRVLSEIRNDSCKWVDLQH